MAGFRMELSALKHRVGRLESVERGEASQEDLVLAQEHAADMARIEGRRAVSLAVIPRALHLISLVVGVAVGFLIGAGW